MATSTTPTKPKPAATPTIETPFERTADLETLFPGRLSQRHELQT